MSIDYEFWVHILLAVKICRRYQGIIATSWAWSSRWTQIVAWRTLHNELLMFDRQWTCLTVGFLYISFRTFLFLWKLSSWSYLYLCSSDHLLFNFGNVIRKLLSDLEVNLPIDFCQCLWNPWSLWKHSQSDDIVRLSGDFLIRIGRWSLISFLRLLLHDRSLVRYRSLRWGRRLHVREFFIVVHSSTKFESILI